MLSLLDLLQEHPTFADIPFCLTRYEEFVLIQGVFLQKWDAPSPSKVLVLSLRLPAVTDLRR